MATADSRNGNLSYSENDGGSFQRHNEHMKKFCLAHPKVAIVETKESKDIKPEERLTLVLLPLVELDRYAQN